MLGKFLRMTGSSLWLAEAGTLSADFTQARKVRSILEALEICRKLDCRGMELVLKFKNSEDDIAVPLITGENSGERFSSGA